jgi:GYF domain 2
MADLWYYGREAEIFGPMSGWDMADLADAGTVLRTDTVWEDGETDGVPASTIAHLFPATTTPTLSLTPPAVTRRPARAVAGPGTAIVGQDGKTVKYRMICTTCRHQQQSWKSVSIPRGTIQVGYFCPKCRKRRTGSLSGFGG